jgi:hypothetical protein
MADETTITSVTELVYGEWIAPFIQSYAGNYLNPSQFFARWDPQNGSSTVSVPRLVSDQGTANDDGAEVDTEFGIAEGTDLSNTELETLDATFSIAEYGIMREITDTVLESASSADAIDWMSAPSIASSAGPSSASARWSASIMPHHPRRVTTYRVPLILRSTRGRLALGSFSDSAVIRYAPCSYSTSSGTQDSTQTSSDVLAP